MSVTIYASITAREARADEVERACRSIVEECLREDGLLTYHLLRDAENPRVFAWFEQWRDEAAFDQHLSSPHAARLGEALEGKLEGDMVIQRFDALA